MSVAASEPRSESNRGTKPDRPAGGGDAQTSAAVWMVVGAFAFACMGACTFALGDRCDWLVVGAARALFMCVSTALVARFSGVRLVFRRPGTLWIRSLAGSFSLVCNFYAMTRLPIGDVLTMTNTYPLWIAIATAISMRRWPAVAECLAIASGLAGVALIQRPELSGDRVAALVALLSSFSTTVAMLGLHRLKHVDARAVVVHFAGVAGAVAMLGLVIRGPSTLQFVNDAATYLLLAGVGVSGTIGQYCLTRAYAAGVPTRVSVAALLEVVFGLGFDVLFWRRAVPPATILGMILILAPTAWVAGRSGGAGGERGTPA